MSDSSNASKQTKPSVRPKPPAPVPRKQTTTTKRSQSPKRSITAAKQQAEQTKKKADKRLQELATAEKLLNGDTSVVTTDILDNLPPTVREELSDPDRILFKPTPRQVLFLAAEEDEVFYGGARGGGKSFSMLVDPLRYCENKNHRALMLRRTMPELRDMIAKSHMLYPKAFPGAKWREQDKEWRFPSGARIEFGYAENMIDALRYQGQSYSWIGVDELPQFPTADVYNFLRSSLRSVDPTLPAYFRSTGNPGNVGSQWVKEMFIDPAPPNTRFSVETKIHHPTRGVITSHITRKYIPSTVFDNPYLTYDDKYITMLASLPEVQKRQFLEGDWSVFDGAAFSEFKTSDHVVEPFEVPSSWTRFRAADWGYSSPACCLWFAVDPDNTLYVYRELYVKGKNAEQFAQLVLDAEYGEVIRYGILDSSTWSQRGDTGPSIAETMIKYGCTWRPSDRSPKSRVNGKLEVHRRLAIDPHTEQPRLKIFSSCRNLIRTLPMLPLDSNNSEDIDTTAEDHAYDALRYGVMSRPLSYETPYDMRHLSRPHSYTASDSTFGY